MPLDKDDIVWVNDRAYDVRSFAKVHPGGETFVSLYGGRDATTAFATYHRRAFPHKSMTKYEIETKSESSLHSPTASSSSSDDDKEYLALCKEVNSYLQRTGRGRGFAPSYYYAKVAFILLASIACEYWLVTSPSYSAACVLGFLFAAIGLNIQHDANHGAISSKPWVNIVLGMTQDWIGGNSLLWLQQHIAIHHVECNDLDFDTDMLDTPLLRFSPTRAKYFWQSLQGFYFVLLEAGYAAKVVFADWYNLLMNMYEGVPISKAVPSWRWYSSVLARLIWTVRFIVIPLHLHGLQAWLPYFAVFSAVGGGYLAFFFLLSHNFEEVYHVVDDRLVPAQDPIGTKKEHPNTLFRRQVLTSSNVGGAWLAELNGGLNYQIEHHLFPRIHHSHYAAISSVVKDYCERRNVPYIHFASVGENFQSTSRFLTHQGTAASVSRKAQ
eukprot:TRINITY_DN7234_c0_g1_i1.p1 TRINITY_DN7234_c0_g1~~TRINITY_DN7234_c0_g1_i1.p1  ORF type:complete len:439 (+),score=93.87 TRINITY_DN7234_c0_g1_i1:56-1372(+)